MRHHAKCTQLRTTTGLLFQPSWPFLGPAHPRATRGTHSRSSYSRLAAPRKRATCWRERYRGCSTLQADCSAASIEHHAYLAAQAHKSA